MVLKGITSHLNEINKTIVHGNELKVVCDWLVGWLAGVLFTFPWYF